MVQCLDLTTYASSITGVDEGLYRHKGGFIHRLAYAHTPRPYRQEGRLVYLFLTISDNFLLCAFMLLFRHVQTSIFHVNSQLPVYMIYAVCG